MYSVQLPSHVWLFVTLWTPSGQASLSITKSRRLLKLMSIELVMLSNHSYSVVPFSSHLQSCPASGSFQMSQFFASGGQSIGVSALASVLPMKYSELISFRIDWFDFLAVQETLRSLLQHHSSKASILRCSAFFMVQLSHHTWLQESGSGHSVSNITHCKVSFRWGLAHVSVAQAA